MINYVELMKHTALLKAAKKFVDNDADDCVETFKLELQEAIDKAEKDMQDYDDWVSMKEQEAINNVD